MLNQAPEINTNPSTSTSYQATDIPQAFKDKKYLNTWKKSGNNYRYQTLKRTHLFNTILNITTNNNKIISNSVYFIVTNDKMVSTNTSIIFTAIKVKPLLVGYGTIILQIPILRILKIYK